MKNNLTIIFVWFFLYGFSQELIEKEAPNYIKSVELRPLQSNSFLPIIKLNESFIFKFDDLEGDQKEYQYKITHCTYNWENSNLSDTDFSSGFAYDRIRNFENSFNTFLDYTHYEVRIPNKNVRLTITGNYLLSIYDEYDELIFTKRFIIYQPKVSVGVSVHKARKIKEINSKQNVEFTINHPNILFDNPYKEVKVSVFQNMNWNTMIRDIKPQFIRNSQLLYKYGNLTTFLGGNEFLYFDTKDYRISSNNIRRTVLKDDTYHTRLYVDETRANKPYTYYPDINGNFVIRSITSKKTDSEAEYTKVHFFLDFPKNDEKQIYIYGAFNDWKLTNENLMQYNSDINLYEGEIFFKQGFYNYEYVTLDKNGNIDIAEINGSFYQTENKYQVIIYYRKFGGKYDKVIGFGEGNSVNLQN
jgi:hypothetical protein